MVKLSIDRVGPRDGSLLDDIADGVFHDPIDAEFLEPYLSSPSALLVVARHAGRVVGQARGAIHLHPDKAADLYLDELVVAPTYLRQGIARLLLREIEQWARERGCFDVWLATAADNGPAQMLYRSFAEAKPCMLYFWEL